MSLFGSVWCLLMAQIHFFSNKKIKTERPVHSHQNDGIISILISLTIIDLFHLSYYSNLVTISVWKVSVFGAFLVRIFPHSDWIRRYTPCLFVSEPNAEENGRENFKQTLLTKSMVRLMKASYSVFSIKSHILKWRGHQWSSN